MLLLPLVALRGLLLIKGRGVYKTVGGQVKVYPYKKARVRGGGGGAKIALSMLNEVHKILIFGVVLTRELEVLAILKSECKKFSTPLKRGLKTIYPILRAHILTRNFPILYPSR